MRAKKIIVLVLITLLLTIGTILYSEKEKMIQITEEAKIALNEQSDNNEITTINVTGIELGRETEHEHLYKTMYDKTTHWEECNICNEKRNEIAHSYTTKWASRK